MKNTQVQNKEKENTEKSKRKEVGVSKIEILNATQLPKFGVLMQTEY